QRGRHRRRCARLPRRRPGRRARQGRRDRRRRLREGGHPRAGRGQRRRVPHRGPGRGGPPRLLPPRRRGPARLRQHRRRGRGAVRAGRDRPREEVAGLAGEERRRLGGPERSRRVRPADPGRPRHRRRPPCLRRHRPGREARRDRPGPGRGPGGGEDRRVRRGREEGRVGLRLRHLVVRRRLPGRRYRHRVPDQRPQPAAAVVIRRLTVLLLTALVPLSAGLAGAGQAQAVGYRYWSFWERDGGQWTYATEGPSTARPADGDVQGFRFSVSEDSGDAAKPRGAAGFDTICAGTPAQDGRKRVALVLDFGTAADAPSGETPPEGRTVCARVAENATTAQALAAVAKPLRYDTNALLCAIEGYPKSGCGEQVSG